MFIYYWETERHRAEHEQGRGRERGRHRIRSRLQALSHQPRARRGAQTHKLRDHDLSRSQSPNQLSHPGAPFKKIFKCLFIFEREWVSASAGEAERKGDIESEASSRLRAVSTEPEVGLKLTNHEIMTWTEVRCLTVWATQAPSNVETFQI